MQVSSTEMEKIASREVLGSRGDQEISLVHFKLKSVRNPNKDIG